MQNVTKEIFLNTLVCPTLGWLMRTEQISLKQTFSKIMEEEMGIGRRARELYPEGILIDDENMESASQKTKSLMDGPSTSILFEATFLIDRLVARADILKRNDEGWHLFEVKSSVNDKKDFIDDMAYTTMVIEYSEINISQSSLILISKDFRLGMENDKLFLEIDHTDEVRDRVEEFKTKSHQIEEITRNKTKPPPKLELDCRKCEIFKDCLGKDIENHIFDLQRLSRSKFDKLKELGIFRIEDIPNGFPLTEIQAKVKKSVQLKQPIVGNQLKVKLESILWPTFYLDFETFLTPVPLFPKIAPYTQSPTQYSIHKCSEPGQIIDHFEYLADHHRDFRKEFAEHLIKDLRGKGSIVVYSNFEKTIITNLVEVYPDLSKDLNSLIDRLVNLEHMIKKNFYHPNFHGSTSVKTVLPALVPGMSYDSLEIADGDTAMLSFAFLALEKYEDKDIEKVRRNLLAYCEQDTLAMVKLHKYLLAYV
ncbi:DUF2779 domain-containing protein [Candidatus Borrarchaeum sp.]|uniref:DUF2779 domain-containing protein n=1 Tax=Candidatus Borrarchaeum sp. TaxID=2846742 RepID=UPI00257A97DB|nr:DUF2779 domain-containing protein [Candidatus Borrarchaeum sp.]